MQQTLEAPVVADDDFDLDVLITPVETTTTEQMNQSITCTVWICPCR